MWQLWHEAQSDPEYAQMLVELRALEPEYEAVLKQLPAQQEDILRDYLSLCEAMSWRLFQIACVRQEK